MDLKDKRLVLKLRAFVLEGFESKEEKREGNKFVD